MDTLHLVFAGMIAFAGNSQDDSLVALLVDVTAPKGGSPTCAAPGDYNESNRDLAHEAFVLVPPGSVIECAHNADRDAWEDVSTGPCTWKRFVLTGHDLGLEASTTTQELRRRRHERTDACGPMNHEEFGSFGWVADVERIAPSRALVKEACRLPDPLSPQDERDDCPLVGRMTLPPGIIGTSHMKTRKVPTCTKGDRTCYTGYVTFDFVEHDRMSSPRTGVGSALAEEVTLTVTTPRASERTLHLTAFGEDAPACSVSLPSGVQNVWILNSEKGLTYEDCRLRTVEKTAHLDFFQEFYKLSQTSHERGRCPRPREVCGPMGSPRCPVALMSFD